MVYFYLILSAILILVMNNFSPIFGQGYSLWLVPLLLVGFFVGLVLLHAIVFVLSFLIGGQKRPPGKLAKYYRFLAKITVPLVLKLARVEVNVRGIDVDELPKDKRMLFVCNHKHEFDPVVMLSVFPEHELGFIGKKEIFEKMFLIGDVMHKLYGLPIDRENNREAAKTIVNAIKILKEDKASVGLFPEGYTNRTEDLLLPFRNGAFKIAYKAQVPIVVCTINGTRQIPKRMFRKKSEVDFCIAKIIYPEEFADLNTQELGDKIHLIMEKALKKDEN
jgi:1-acyl-sn-glycerol-3-phosphate acyltransferase